MLLNLFVNLFIMGGWSLNQKPRKLEGKLVFLSYSGKL